MACRASDFEFFYIKKSYFIVVMTFCMLAFHAKGQPSVGIKKTDVNLSNFWINESHMSKAT